MHVTSNDDITEEVKFLPVAAIASALQRFEHVPFETAGMTASQVHDALCQRILEEVASVNAYTTSWRGSGMIPVPEQKSVSETLHSELSQDVYPWPQIASF